MVLFGFEKELMWGYMASFLHECAHLGMSIRLKCMPLSMTFGICAINLETQRATNTKKHIKIVAAGPVFSFVMFGALFCLRKAGVLDVRIFEFTNLCIALANLFPATPLDGGRILKLCLMSHYGIIYGAAIMRAITNVMISLIASANAFLIIFDKVNPFLFIFLSFLIFSLCNEKREDLYLKEMVLSGQMPSSCKARRFCFESDCRLIDIASRVSPSYYLVGFIFESERFLGEIEQSELPCAMKAMGAIARAEDYVKAKEMSAGIYAIEKSQNLLYNEKDK